MIDCVCFSHLRWNFVYQRPQHLLTRLARRWRVFYLEEPVYDAETPQWEFRPGAANLVVGVPHLPPLRDSTTDAVDGLLRRLVDEFRAGFGVKDFVLWYYTPMALGFSRQLEPAAVVYDCMDELSAFLGAPPEFADREQELFARADLVFTGGPSLYQAKRRQHPNVHLFPSSVDVAHFGRARLGLSDPADQAAIPRPRLGFFGVIDERLDSDLIDRVAAARPDWQIVLVGPVVKIDPATLPKRANLHYLGPKEYSQLPDYLAAWDIALLPFARNQSTRFISPTKTPEYLAAGKPVVSTRIPDVVQLHGSDRLVQFEDSPTEFIAAVEAAQQQERGAFLRRVDDRLADMSWDRIAADQFRLIQEVLDPRLAAAWTRPQMSTPVGD